jgi:glycosyltransferase involved in cell wall biosynthesis
LGDIYKSYQGQQTGGAELQQALIVKYLVKAGHKVVVLDLKLKENRLDQNGVDFYGLGQFATRSSRKKAIRKLCAQVKADVYYGRMRNALHRVVQKAAHKQGAVYIYHCAHDLDTLSFKERKDNYYRKGELLYNIKKFYQAEIMFPAILKHADLIFAQHRLQQENLYKKGLKQVEVIYNLFEFPKLDIKPQNGEYVLIFGSLDERKGVKYLEEIITRCKDTSFIVLGQARDKVGKAFIDNIKTFDHVQYIPAVPHDDVYQYIAESKLILSASLMEGFSNAFIEAWSLGKPVYSLFAEAGGNIAEYGLGEYFNGDIETLIRKINIHDIQFDGDKIRQYVIDHHLAENSIKKIERSVKQRHDRQ